MLYTYEDLELPEGVSIQKECSLLVYSTINQLAIPASFALRKSLRFHNFMKTCQAVFP